MMIAEGWVLLSLRNLLQEGAIQNYTAKGKVYFVTQDNFMKTRADNIRCVDVNRKYS